MTGSNLYRGVQIGMNFVGFITGISMSLHLISLAQNTDEITQSDKGVFSFVGAEVGRELK